MYWVNNGDNYTKLFTLLTYFRLPRFRRRPMGAVAADRLGYNIPRSIDWRCLRASWGPQGGIEGAVRLSHVSIVWIRSSGRVGCGPQHRQRQPHALPGGFSVHQVEHHMSCTLSPVAAVLAQANKTATALALPNRVSCSLVRECLPGVCR